MPKPPKKSAIYALLDLDNTVITTNSEKLNISLLQSLKDAGINNLCFFTSMDTANITADLQTNEKGYTRLRLIETLQSPPWDFTVHSVITPNDVYFEEKKQYPGCYFEKRWEPAYKEAEKKVLKGKEVEESFNKSEVDKEKDAAQKVDNTYCRDHLGGEHTAAATQYLNAKKRGKGAMYELALRHLETIPKKGAPAINSFIYFDDLAHELDAVAKESKSQGKKIPLSCIEIQTEIKAPQIKGQKERQILQKSDLDPTKNQIEVKQRYDSAIAKHKAALKEGKVETLYDKPSAEVETFKVAPARPRSKLPDEEKVISTREDVQKNPPSRPAKPAPDLSIMAERSRPFIRHQKASQDLAGRANNAGVFSGLHRNEEKSSEDKSKENDTPPPSPRR